MPYSSRWNTFQETVSAVSKEKGNDNILLKGYGLEGLSYPSWTSEELRMEGGGIESICENTRSSLSLIISSSYPMFWLVYHYDKIQF